MLDRRHHRLRDPHGRWRPRAGGAALVVGLHGVALALTVAIGPAPARNVAAQAIDVRLIASPQHHAASTSPLPAAAVSLAQPEAPLLPSVPGFTIQAAVVHAAAAIASPRDHLPPKYTEATPTDAPASVPAATEPAQIRRVAYERFGPPEYPPMSRRLGESGVVVLRVLIDEVGLPREVQVETSSGYPRLDEAAIAAVRRARFVPHSEGGRARAAVARVPIRFELT
jgi:protein TonB